MGVDRDFDISRGRICGAREVFIAQRDFKAAVGNQNAAQVMEAPRIFGKRISGQEKTPPCSAQWGFLNASRRRPDLRKSGRLYEI